LNASIAAGERAWLWRYLRAAHAARVVVAGFAVFVAVRTTDEIPVAGRFHIALAAAALAWTLALAIACRPLDRMLRRCPRLIWLDSVVLVGLALADKPWDAMVAVPYGAFLLLVVYGSPVGLAVLTVALALLQYVPKIALSAVGWRYAGLCPPVTTADWMTAYVGPLVAGTICVALCVLVNGVQKASADWDRAERVGTEAQVRGADARARRAVAERLHETISQAVRAIPLRLDGPAPAGLGDDAVRLRAGIAGLAREVRPQVQRVARELRAEADD